MSSSMFWRNCEDCTRFAQQWDRADAQEHFTVRTSSLSASSQDFTHRNATKGRGHTPLVTSAKMVLMQQSHDVAFDVSGAKLEV